MNFFRAVWQAITAPFRWLFSLPVMIISAPRRLLGMALPARVAVLTAAFLVTCILCAIVAVVLSGEAAVRNWFLPIWQPILIFVLLIAIPLLVYYTLKLWLEGDVSRFPDIDAAWNEGLAALEENGLDLSNIPLFLVTGLPDQRHTKSLLESSGMDWMVDGVPRGRAALHWYANEEGGFLVCTEAGRLSLLNRRATGRARSAEPAQRDVRGTLEAPGVRGTLVASAETGQSKSVTGSSAAQPAESSEPAGDFGALRGTLVPGGSSSTASGGPAAALPSTTLVSRQEADEQSERLEYVCQYVRRRRQPLAPLNGILTVMSLDTVQNAISAREIPEAIRKDTSVIRDATSLRCPVTALVTGMESQSGFCELIKRVGAERAKRHRFGKGFDVWNAPSDENMDALSAHACGAFEDWVYNLFRERDGFGKPGNSKLFMLLCTIRGRLQQRLRNILVSAYGYSPDEKRKADPPPLFSGCYFAGTGEAPPRQAFVRNVFEKMLELEEELEWTDAALQEDTRYQRLASIVLLLDATLAIALVSLLVYYFFL